MTDVNEFSPSHEPRISLNREAAKSWTLDDGMALLTIALFILALWITRLPEPKTHRKARR